MHKNETAHVTDCHLIGFNKTRSANCDRTDRMVPKLAIVVATGSNVLKMVVVMTQKYIFASSDGIRRNRFVMQKVETMKKIVFNDLSAAILSLEAFDSVSEGSSGLVPKSVSLLIEFPIGSAERTALDMLTSSLFPVSVFRRPLVPFPVKFVVTVVTSVHLVDPFTFPVRMLLLFPLSCLVSFLFTFGHLCIVESALSTSVAGPMLQ